MAARHQVRRLRRLLAIKRGCHQRSASGTSGAPAMTGDANTDYNAAIALVKDASRQDDAMVAFQNFVKKYPDSTYQPNANYWLGS